MQICTNTPIPDLSDLLKKIQIPSLPSIPQLAIPQLGGLLPTLPSPLLPSFSMPQFELVSVALALQQFQIMSLVKALVEPIINWTGINIPFPSLPSILPISFPKLLIGPLNLADIKIPEFIIPNVFDKLTSPVIQTFANFQTLIANYTSSIAAVLKELMQKVIDKANIKPFELGLVMPTMPVMPTVPDILSKLKLSLPEFPGFPPIPALPFPLFPGLSIPNLELSFSLSALTTHLSSVIIKIMMDWCLKLTDLLGISFSIPTICINI